MEIINTASSIRSGTFSTQHIFAAILFGLIDMKSFVLMVFSYRSLFFFLLFFCHVTTQGTCISALPKVAFTFNNMPIIAE